VASDGTAVVGFSPPASNGGAPVSSYTVTSAPGGLTATGPQSPLTVTGLAARTSYTFTVTAANSAGPGAPSAPSPPVEFGRPDPPPPSAAEPRPDVPALPPAAPRPRLP
jgi:hypothetical protein